MEKAIFRCRRLCFSMTFSRWSSVKSHCIIRNGFRNISLSSGVKAPVGNGKGLADDPSWEAEVLRHEKLLNELKNAGVTEEDLPVLERDRKVNALPHTSYQQKKHFQREDALLSETARLLLGNVIPAKADVKMKKDNLDENFIRDDVQEILQRLHYSSDMEKAYRSQIQKRSEMPTIRYLTEEQLKEAMEKMETEAREKLRMLPVFVERAACEDVLAEDSILDGHEQSKLSFVDISDNLNPRERFIVIREPNGTLRRANWNERDRLIQTYYPKPHRKIVPPSIFNAANLQNVFEMNIHENALDQCVVQFEPDSKEYIEVFEAVFKDIYKKELFDSLRSTRYFGGFLFYLARTFQLDGIILNMLRIDRIDNASDCVKLLVLLHPTCQTKSVIDKLCDDVSVVEAYIKLDSKIPEKLLSALKPSHSSSGSEDVV